MPLFRKSSRLAIVLVTALQSILSEASGCGSSLPDGQTLGSTTNVSITSDGLERTYLIFIPESYNSSAPTPLILSFHGGGRNAKDQLELDELTNPEFNTASIVIYPEGLNETWEGAPGATTNDVLFSADILDDVESQYCIDTSRISATGKSEGGGLVNLLACNATTSTLFASFAPVSGAYYVETSPCEPETVTLPCSPARENIPMLAFHGGEDTVIPYDGGEQEGACLPSIPHFIQEWSLRNVLGNTNLTTLIEVETWTYLFNESRPGLVGLVYEANIGHDWPSTEPNSDNTEPGQHVANYNATPILLEFFNNHSLPSNATSTTPPTTTSTGVVSSTTATASSTSTSTKSDATSYISQSYYQLLISISPGIVVLIAFLSL